MSALGMTPHREELPPDRRATSLPDTGDGDTLGEYLEIDPETSDIENVQLEDGGMMVYLGEAVEDPQAEDGDFYGNLAEVLPDTTLQKIVTDLLTKIEEDKSAREKRIQQYEEGLKRTGMGKDAPGGAQFEGASKVVHPGLTEGCIDYQSRIMKEMWPVAGPAKPRINGVVTKEKTERAARVCEYMNFQLTTQMTEARTVTEKMLSQVPLGGSQFIRQVWDLAKRRPKWSFVSIDKVILPASASDYESANRKTYVEPLTEIEIKQRINSGLYREVKLGRTAMVPESNKAEQAQAKIEGKEAEPSVNVDNERDVYEIQVLLECLPEMADVLQFEEEGGLYPYIISVDPESKETLAFYRNWDQNDDDARQALSHIYEFPFVTWDGAYAVGLPHIAGGLSGAATGALRALLDSAHIANTQGGFVLKGSGIGGQTKQPQVGEMCEVDGGLETDDIRKKIMAFNTKEPSNVLFQLLGFLVDAQRSVVRTSMDDSAIDTNANTPVGTQLSRVEEGMVVFSAIHGRAHAAFNRLLAGLYRLNAQYLPDEPIRVDLTGKEVMVRRRDFQGPPAIQPVSDPTIYSDQQRFAQITAMQQRSALVPGLYNARALEERFLKVLKVPDPEEVLVKATEPQEQNAINENLAMGLGRPVVVFPDQDHLAHLQAHFDFANSPVMGANPIIAPKFTPLFVQHAAEHMLYHYAKTSKELVEHGTGMDMAELMSSDPEVKEAMDRLLAICSQQVVPSMDQDFQKAMPIIMGAVQKMQAMAPKGPIDPAQAALQASMAETQRKAKDDMTTAQLDQQKNAIMSERNQIQQDGNNLRAHSEIVRTIMDTRSAQDIAAMRLTQGHSPGFSDGSSLG